jgi:hypothetical protein
MSEALAAVADDGDLLALYQIDVGVPIVINAHFLSFPDCLVLWRMTGPPGVTS